MATWPGWQDVISAASATHVFEGEFEAGHTYHAVTKRIGTEVTQRLFEKTQGGDNRPLVFETQFPATLIAGSAGNSPRDATPPPGMHP